MSTRRRKRRGQAVNSERAQKRSRLLGSSAGGTSGAEPIDLEESDPVCFEFAVEETRDSTGEYFLLRATNCFLVWEQNEQHPHISGEAENSPVLPTRNNEEEQSNDFDSRPEWTFSSPIWVDENSQPWEQNEQQEPLPAEVENSPLILTCNNEEEPGNDDDSRPEWTFSSPIWVDENSQPREHNEQHRFVSASPENSPVLLTRDNEEERSTADDISRPEWTFSSPIWVDENSQPWEHNEQQEPLPAEVENSPLILTCNNEEEPGNDDDSRPEWTFSSPIWVDENSQPREHNEQHRFVSASPENSPVLPTRDNEEELRINDDSRPEWTFSSPIWVDENSQPWEQNEQQEPLPAEVENSPLILTCNNEEEPGNDDDSRPEWTFSSPIWVDENSQPREHNEQHRFVSASPENSPVLPTRDNEEELRINDDSRPEWLFSSPIWVDENSQPWEQNEQQEPLPAEVENSPLILTCNNEEEPGNDDDSRPEWTFSSPIWVDENSQPWEHNEQHRFVSASPENSPVLPTRDNEEERSTADDISRPEWTFSSPIWVDENSQPWEHNEQQEPLPAEVENSPLILTCNNEEEPGNDDDSRPEWTFSSPIWVDENSQPREHNEQHRFVSASPENSPVLPTRDNEEELRINDDSRPEWLFSSPIWVDENSQPWEQNEQQEPLPAEVENSPLILTCNNEEEPGNDDDSRPEWTFSSPIWVDENSQPREHNEQHRFVSASPENSPVLPTRDNEEELRINDDSRPEWLFSSPIWVDENSQPWEQNEQQEPLPAEVENSPLILTCNNEEEPGNDDDSRPEWTFSSPIWVDENSQPREHNEQHRFVSASPENSPVLPTRDNEEELRINDDSRPEWLFSSPIWVDENSQPWEHNEQHQFVSASPENSPVLPTRDNEEERSTADDVSRPEWTFSSPIWVDENSQPWEHNEQHRFVSASPENSPVLPTRDNEEEQSTDDDVTISSSQYSLDENSQPREHNEQHRFVSASPENSPVLPTRDNEEEQSTDDDVTISSSQYSLDENSQPSEGYGRQRRNLSLRSQQQSNSSVWSRDNEDETRANGVYVTATASEQQESSDEDTSSSHEWQPAFRCPVCMDFYSRILKRKRMFLVTRCGHVFCSRCLPAAIEVSGACPTCRTELTQEHYHPVYI